MQLPATEVENIVQDVVSSKDNDVDNTLLVIPVTDDDADNSHTLYIVQCQTSGYYCMRCCHF